MRLLVVDDDPAVRTALGRLLSLRHEVTVASGVLEARAFIASDAVFDAVLCDVVMPDGSGLELTRHIVAVRPELKGRVVLMTGGAASAEEARALNSVDAEVIAKPFDIARIEAALARTLR